MREIRKPFIKALALVLCFHASTTVPAQAESLLDRRLDALYDSVAAKFGQNPWFKNTTDPDLAHYTRNSSSFPDYQMLDRKLFIGALKSYCVLLESPAGKSIKNPAHFGIVNYSQHSAERRLYIYDLSSQSIQHNLWTAHGWNSRIGIWYSLKDLGVSEYLTKTKEVAIAYNENAYATLFSNRKESNQSSVGMAIADSETYYSPQHEWTALRLTGLDKELNSSIRERAVVFHEWGFNSRLVLDNLQTPLSEGCPMLPRSGYYQGADNADIAKIVMRELYGAPVLFYQDRLDPKINEKTYQEQLKTIQAVKAELSENMSSFAEQYEWSAETRKRYESVFAEKIDSTYNPLIEETYRYFKNRSLYYGVEPKNMDRCMKALGI